MIRRIFKGRMIPMLVIFFAIIIPQLFIQSFMDAPLARVNFVAFGVLFIVYLVTFIKFAIHYVKLKKD